MARGIEGRNVFSDDEDRGKFLELFSKGLKKNNFTCYAWTLMGNHYHLLLLCGDRPLADLMRPLNSRYAQYHGRKYRRRGYLFQDRYKSVATQDQMYVRALVRYVHSNPLRAGICKRLTDLGRYKWSSHAALMGKQDCEFVASGAVLRRFGKTKQDARKSYLAFMGAGMELPTDKDDDFIKAIRLSNEGRAQTHNPGCWVIGDSEFVKKAIAADKANRARLARFRAEGVTIEALGRRFSKAIKTPETELLRRSRGTHWRQIFALLCRAEYGFPVGEIGRYLGISSQAASAAIKLGSKHIASNNSLQGLIC